jgi:hypothetical protein
LDGGEPNNGNGEHHHGGQREYGTDRQQHNSETPPWAALSTTASFCPARPTVGRGRNWF